MADRFSQMSVQAALIAKKKAEIEAKKRKTATGEEASQEGQSLQSDSQQLPGGQGQIAVAADDGAAGSAAKVAHKNRWGFKGKSASPAANAFENDGSFLETFRKIKPPDEVKQEKRDDWYQSAVERARCIALSLKRPASEPQPDAGQQTALNDRPSGGGRSGPGQDGDNGQQVSPAPELHTDALPVVVQELASMVAISGDQLEELARVRNVGEEQLAFLQDTKSDLYKQYRCVVESMRKGMAVERLRSKESPASRKKSRWDDSEAKQADAAAHDAGHGRDPQLVQYAIRVFGSVDLSPEQWKQCEDQIKMNVVYTAMVNKKKQLEKLQQQGKHKYEYDSDEDVEGGTWEHKARKAEMDKTRGKADLLTEAGKGKHHIGDFLPPEELTKFMAKYQALKNGAEFDDSDYSDSKLTNDNLGFKMLQRMGWTEGSGLGTSAQGITAPVSKGSQNADKKGLGTGTPHLLERDDDEYEAYRKRMMLAYRFRPNPLNNPRRPYY